MLEGVRELREICIYQGLKKRGRRAEAESPSPAPLDFLMSHGPMEGWLLPSAMDVVYFTPGTVQRMTA